MSLIETVILFGGIGLFNLLVCLPLLLFSSVRRLFNRLPMVHLIVNYFLGMGVFTLFHSALLIVVIVVSGGLEGVGTFWGLGGVTIGTGLFAFIVAGFVFPRLNWWTPAENEDELDGRIALALGLTWYTVCTGIALLLLLVFLIALFFPG